MMSLTNWIVWTLFLLFFNLYNFYYFFLEMKDRKYRKYVPMKIIIFSLSFIFIFLSLFFYLYFFILPFFFLLIFFILKKYLTFNDITLFFMFSLIFLPLPYSIASKTEIPDQYFVLFVAFNIIILLLTCTVLFFINIVMQIDDYAKRKQQPQNKDKPDEL